MKNLFYPNQLTQGSLEVVVVVGMMVGNGAESAAMQNGWLAL